MENIARKILLVDDDLSIRESLSALLENDGYRVCTAVDGAQAMRALRRGPRPDAIVLDLMMPVLGGREFLEEKERQPRLRDLPVVVLTAYLEEAPMRAHVAAFLKKPFDVPRLLEVVEDVLG